MTSPPSGRQSTTGFQSIVTAVMVAGTAYVLSLNAGTVFSGSALIEVAVPSTSTGILQLVINTAGGTPIIIDLADSAESGWHTYAGSATAGIVKLSAFPPLMAYLASGGVALQWIARTAGSQTVQIRAIPFTTS